MKSLLWGILLWLGATIIFRIGGQLFLIPGNHLLIILTFILAVPLIAGTTFPYYRWFAPATNRVLTAVLIALPGMMFDIFSVLYFEKLFPNLDPSAESLFSAWLLWAYSLILLSGFVFSPAKSRPAN
ncbi:DUF5367 domain-containing protein [Neobacillus drentensis]|uniref:DUF5367 domain-containing protein n=1 Tax=Neobacillus drentensis TaxID=220684 RepID=UPI002FFF83FC